MLPRRRVLALIAALAAAPLVRADTAVPAEVRAALPDARLQGQGSMRFLGLLVYEARLWSAAQPVLGDDWLQPLALEIVYARRLDGRKIAERSLEEMRRVGPMVPEQAERWLAEMTRLFPDVRNGDRITGVQRPGEGVRFYLNADLRGELRDPEFGRFFFGIWLSPRTSEPRLRESLLGSGRG